MPARRARRSGYIGVVVPGLNDGTVFPDFQNTKWPKSGTAEWYLYKAAKSMEDAEIQLDLKKVHEAKCQKHVEAAKEAIDNYKAAMARRKQIQEFVLEEIGRHLDESAQGQGS